MHDSDSYISVSGSDLIVLKKLYEDSKPGEVFTFKGKKVLREYAKYLIEYIEGEQMRGGLHG